MKISIFSGFRRQAKPVGLQTGWRLRQGHHLQQLLIRSLLSGMSTLASGWMSGASTLFPRSLRSHFNCSWTQCPTDWKKNIEICLGVCGMTCTVSRWKRLVSMALWTKGWWTLCEPFSTKSRRDHQQHHPPQQPGWHHAPNKSSCQLDYLRHLVLTSVFIRN